MDKIYYGLGLLSLMSSLVLLGLYIGKVITKFLWVILPVAGFAVLSVLVILISVLVIINAMSKVGD